MKLKVGLFIVTQILLFGVFLLTLKYSEFDLIAPNGNDIEIEITGSNRGTHKLELSGPDEVDAGRKITWKIRDTVNDVIWFEIVKKPGHKDVFRGPTPTGTRQRTAVGLLKNQTNRIDWEYSINWLDAEGNPLHPYDPKIAIKPGTGFVQVLLQTSVYLLLVALISFLAFKK